jgi:type II secretory pathway component PulC
MELVAGVREVKPNRFTVSRKALAIITDIDNLERTARVVPSRDHDGVMLFGMRRDSIPRVLGFDNGDRVTELNDMRLTDPKAALEAYRKLSSKTKTVVKLVRRGKRLTLEYTVVDP